MKKKIHNLKLFRLITQVILFIFYVNIKKENTITFILSSNSIHKKRKKRHKTLLILIVYLKRVIILIILNPN